MTDRVTAVHPTRDAIRSAWGLFAAVLFLMLGNGLLGTLLGIRAELEGFATAVTGVIMASYYLGFLVGSQYAPVALVQVGHVRVFAALASLASSATLVHIVFVSPGTWAVMRFIVGFCMAGLYVVAESWINDRATNATRGRLLSVYMVVMMGGIAAGQLLLDLSDPGSFELFVFASVLVSLAVVPISLSARPTPIIEALPKVRRREFWKIAPLGLIGGLGAGVAHGALLGMGPVYAASVGMSVSRIGIFMGLAFVGAVFFQIPIGTWSDKVPRERAVLAVTVVAAATSAIAVTVDANSVVLLAMMFVFGGLSFPLYSVSLSYINDVTPEGQTVAASSVYLFHSGLGAIAGPLFAAWLITAFGPVGYWWSLTIAHGAIGVYAFYRSLVGRDLPTRLQKAYAPYPARASAMIAQLTKARPSVRRKRNNHTPKDGG